VTEANTLPVAQEDPLVQVKHVAKSFIVKKGVMFSRRETTLKALRDVSLTIGHGEIVGCVGESGCGKTTLAKVILRLLDADSGSVMFEGADISTLEGERLKEYRRSVQLLFQDPYSSLPPRMSVRTIVTEPMAIHAIGSPAERRERCEELMAAVGLSASDLNRYPHQFSGGQRQRIALARALALDPKLLICDEPTSALDVSIQAQILNLLLELQVREGYSYLFISHDLRTVRYLSQRIAVMYLGQLVELGRTDEVYGHPLHPYTAALLQSVPTQTSGGSRRRLSVLHGEVPSAFDIPAGCSFYPRCSAAQEICRDVSPELKAWETGRLVACHFPLFVGERKGKPPQG
jgi:oligopeptide/dipeptide ABC transporter ATP-binding protein